jgi:hypothetical protein
MTSRRQIGDILTGSFAATFSDTICTDVCRWFGGGGGSEGIKEKPRSCPRQGRYKSKHLHATENFMLINIEHAVQWTAQPIMETDEHQLLSPWQHGGLTAATAGLRVQTMRSEHGLTIILKWITNLKKTPTNALYFHTYSPMSLHTFQLYQAIIIRGGVDL